MTKTTNATTDSLAAAAKAEARLRSAYASFYKADSVDRIPFGIEWVERVALEHPALEADGHEYLAGVELAALARNNALLAIARKHLDVQTFERQMSGADFQEQAIWCLQSALEAAYEAGRASR